MRLAKKQDHTKTKVDTEIRHTELEQVSDADFDEPQDSFGIARRASAMIKP